jgi:hypothetical protein
MQIYTIALFGEAEKGNYKTPYHCRTLNQLIDFFGNPPEESRGLFFAIQALLYHRDLIFFRVKEEGFSLQDYMQGLKILEQTDPNEPVAAICLPGVGSGEIIEVSTSICQKLQSILITTESDFYDYLTEIHFS